MKFFVTLTSDKNGSGIVLINPEYIAMCEDQSASTLITLKTGEKITVKENTAKIARLCASLLE
jgi:uncharacterized protein YlzI (FlbEa/FlbD family)